MCYVKFVSTEPFGETAMHFLALLLLPIVMPLGALHFVLLGITRLFKLRNAEASTWRHLLALDQYANTLLGGDPKETISSRLGRGQASNCLICSLLCTFLNLFDPGHCKKSLAAYQREKRND